MGWPCDATNNWICPEAMRPFNWVRTLMFANVSILPNNDNYTSTLSLLSFPYSHFWKFRHHSQLLSVFSALTVVVFGIRGSPWFLGSLSWASSHQMIPSRRIDFRVHVDIHCSISLDGCEFSLQWLVPFGLLNCLLVRNRYHISIFLCSVNY